MIDPVSDAFTTVVSPFDSAISAIISSAALPKVALRNPPMPAPVRAESCWVARPNQPARGIMPNPAAMKSSDSLLKADRERGGHREHQPIKRRLKKKKPHGR